MNEDDRGVGTPRPLREPLEAVRTELGLDDPMIAVRLERAWPEIAGEELAAHVRVEAVREGVAVLRADAPAWAGRVRYAAATILDRARRVLATEALRGVRVRVER